MVNIVITDDEKHTILPRSGSTSRSKDYGSVLDLKGYPIDEQDDALVWTENEETEILRKIDRRLMSFVLVLTFVLNLDRTNLCK